MQIRSSSCNVPKAAFSLNCQGACPEKGSDPRRSSCWKTQPALPCLDLHPCAHMHTCSRNSACCADAVSALTGRSYRLPRGWRPPIIRLADSGSQTMTTSAVSFSCSCMSVSDTWDLVRRCMGSGQKVRASPAETREKAGGEGSHTSSPPLS